MNTIKSLTLTLFISASWQTLCFQAQNKALQATEQETKEIKNKSSLAYLQKERTNLLSDCLSGMPLDLIAIIAEYEPYSIEGVHQRTLPGHPALIRALVALANNECASGSNDHTIKIWNTRTGQCKQTLEEHRSSVYLLVYMTDGRFVSFDTGGYLIFWRKDAEDRWILEHVITTKSIVRAGLSPSPHHLVYGLQDGSIEFSQKKQEKWECTQKIAVHNQPVLALAALSDGRLVSNAADKLAVLTPKEHTTSVSTLEETVEPIYYAPLNDPASFVLAILPDNTIVSGSTSGISIYQESDKKLSGFKRLVNMCWPRNIEKEWSQQQAIPLSSLCSLATLPDKRFAAKNLAGVIFIYAYDEKNKHWKLDQTITNQTHQQTQQTSCPTLATLADGKLATTRSDSDSSQEMIEIWS